MPGTSLDMSAFENLKALAGADFIGELIETFLEDAPKLIEQLRTSLAARDAETFRRAAHSLKSNAASFGAGELSLLAQRLEMLGRQNKLPETGDPLQAVIEAYESAAEQLKGLRG